MSKKNCVVKKRNLRAFQIWLEKLGYAVNGLNGGFTFKFGKEYGLVTADLSGNELAFKLGGEFQWHLRQPDFECEVA